MATPTIEEIQRAIDGATAAGDQRAVDVLTQRQNEIRAQMDDSARDEILSGRTRALSADDPADQPALAKPSTDAQIDAQLETRLDSALPEEPPPPNAGLSSREMHDITGWLGDSRANELATTQYEADQELLKSGTATPTPEQLDAFMDRNVGWDRYSNPDNQQVIIDPKTGEPRWTALPPETLQRVRKHQRDEEYEGSTLQATKGAFQYGASRLPGNMLQNYEAGIEANNNFQRFLLTGDRSLPRAEQERIQALAREKYGDDVDFGEIPASQVKEWIEMNKANELAFRNISGDEFWEARKEYWARGLNYLGARTPGGHMLNIFGADTPGGDLTGPGSYEGIDYTGKREPSFPGASAALSQWERDAGYDGAGLYEGFILPLTKGLTDKTPGEHAGEWSQSFIDENYSEGQLAEREMPIFSSGVEIKSARDIFNSDLYTDPDSKLMNPESLLLMFMENAPELAVSYAVTRGAGGLAARQTATSTYGQTVQTMNKAREAAAGRAGMLAGGGTEGLLVQQHLEAETRTILDTIPMETWAENDLFSAMVDSGMAPEAAKQILSQELASQAGTTGAVITMTTGSFMNRYMGRSAAGRLVNKNPAARRTVGALGEPAQEGTQEVLEMLQTEAAVGSIDPDNPIFSDPNRYYEAFGGGALISTPFGIAGGMQPATPQGIDKADADAARATVDYMEATNERFKFESRISSAEHIADSSPNQRLQDLNKLEQMQMAEAEAILKAEPLMRAFLEKQGTVTAKTELKMLNRLVMRANAMKNDIAVAQTNRTTAIEMWEAERQVMNDRAELQTKVNEQIIKLEDIQSLTGSIEAVQNLEAVSADQEADLVREGYARRNKDGQLVVLPKGRRATKELNRQGRALQNKLDKGYTGNERRQNENLVTREMIDAAGPVEKEHMLFEDSLTGAQNRRAFNERQENIDVKEGQDKKTIEGAAPAVAAIDVDSLAWVNDNMSHSAGDRLLMAVSDAVGKQAGIEVFRLGGDEFAATGASQEALESALQAAATELAETEIVAGEDVVTPQITWGKGENYESADSESLTMKQDRQSRGVIAKRKKKAATYRHRAQQGLFQFDGGRELPRHWHRVRHKVERGHGVEVLTPDGAVDGVITEVTNKRGRPRMRVNIQGREFLFNPSSNHLIVSTTSGADLAWITGDAEYANPERTTLPQTLIDVNIGHLFNNGDVYADLADDFEYSAPMPWWMEDHPQMNYHPTIPYMPVEKKATTNEIHLAESVKRILTTGMDNMPDIHIVEDLDWLRREYPSVVEQIKSELGGSNFSGVRGYMDHIDPSNGIFIFPAHIPGSIDGGHFESGLVETVWHEMIGHYGVRGVFGYEAELRPFMHSLVDSFPRLSDHYAANLGLDKTRPDHKQLLGEEMVAYIAGQVKNGTLKFNKKQQGVWARFVAWIKSIMLKRNLDRFAPVKKFVSIHESKQEFWNDSRVQDLLSRSKDFVRHGNGFNWTPLEDTTKPFVRDRNIFQAGFIQAMNTATFKPSNREKGELAKRYGGKENVPDEVPLFPDVATPNNWKQLIIKAQKEKYMTTRELELSGLSEKGDFYLFRDGTYATLQTYMMQMNGGTMPSRWYQGILPADVAAELDAINDAAEKNFMSGPLEENRGEESRRRINEVTPEIMRTRIDEIMAQKINPKKTQLTKELMQAHMLSENAYRIYAAQQGDYQRMSYAQALERLFGNLTDEEIDNLTDEQKEMIKVEREKTRAGGYNIGYDKDLDRWFDWAHHTTEYSEWSPQGSRYTQDFRVALIKSEGAGGDMGYTGHYAANLMHIRTGVAELLEWDGMPELEFPNDAMKGRLLSLIELQSDWLQKLRKGFGSGAEKSAADQEYNEKRNLLNMVGDQFGRGVSQDVWQTVNDSLRPILNLPDGSSDVGTSGTAFGAMRERARTELGQTWEDITPDQKREIWKRHAIEELDKVRDMFSDARDGVDETITAINDEVIGGSLDARGFQYLDGKAMHRVAASIRGELNKVIDTIQNNLRYADSQANMVEMVNRLKTDFGRNMDRIASSSNYGEGMRLPMIGYRLKPFLEVLYGRTGADANRIAELLSGVGTREMATVRIPSVVLDDANTAMRTGYDPISLMNEIISPSRISRHSDIAPGELLLNAVRAGDEFIDIKVIGNKADVQKAKDLVPKLVRTWMENHAAEKRRISLNNTDVSGSTLGDQDYDWGELETLFNFDEEDVDGESSQTMRDHGVQSFYDYEMRDDGEHLSDIIQYAFDNMGEADWDNLEEQYDGVSRQGETYRNAVEIDGNGDVDNADAEEALDEAREDYRRDVMYDDDTYREEANDRIREEWQERGPTALILGSLPVAWDADGDPTSYVDLMIRAEDPGDSYEMHIDGEEHDYESDLDDAKEGFSDVIKSYYENEEINPPVGAAFGPETAPLPEAPTEEDASAPNWDIVKGNMVENMTMMSDSSQKMDKVFERFVLLKKRLDYGQIHEDSPVSKDEQWRPLALKYLIADAVRRGLGGVMWNNGLSSATRGGMGQSGVTKTRRFSWSKESVGIRGEEQEVYVIRYPDSAEPIVVSRSSMVAVLGGDVAKLVYMQENGKLENAELPGEVVEENEDGTPNRDKYILSTTNNDTTAVYRRSDNAFLGFAQDEDTINNIITQDAEQQRPRRSSRMRGSRQRDEAPPTGEPMGEVISQGLIDEKQAGGLIHIIVGNSVSGYTDTFGRPKLAGARQSYEDITVRMWNKELKKYGVHISDTYVKASDMNKAMQEEGQATMQSPKRDAQIADEHGRLYVAELTGEMHGWVIMSEKKGPVLQDVWTDQVRAESRLNDFIQENYGSDREGVKVMYFPINEKMREEFSGPVAPFHYDPKKDPELESAARKIGHQSKPLLPRIQQWREGIGAEARQGMIDNFYGIKRALNNAGVSDNAYISARLTTSLDSMMKGVLYHGHPVWKDGIVQSEGTGLLDILQPILNDPDTWGLYMAGKRAKGLMLEAFTTVRDNPGKYKTPALEQYNGIDWNDMRKIQQAARHFPGKTENDKVMALFAWKARQDQGSGGVTRREAIKMIASASFNAKRALSSNEKEAEKIYDIVNKATRSKKQKAQTPERRAKTMAYMMKEIKKLTGMGDRDAGAAIEKAQSIIKKAAQAETAKRIKSEVEKGLAWTKKVLGSVVDKKAGKDAKGDINGLIGTGAIERAIQGGREHLFEAHEIDKMVNIGRKLPHFERVAKDYAAFNKKMLDFGEASGVIDGESRPTWENADYVPFYRVDDNRLAGSGMSPSAGIANQRAPIRRLYGGDNRVGDILSNIMMNTTKLLDSSVKNQAALDSIDALRGSGIISKKPMDWKQETIPMAQFKKVLIDRRVIVPDNEQGIHLSDIPADALQGMQKMFAVKAPSGDGVLSVMRDGKREYYYTDDMLLYRAMGSINKHQFGDWINYFRAPKRLLTTLITIDPAFMVSNFVRDTGSSFVIGRDKGNLPVLSALKGFKQALLEDETMRTLVSAGAAFENGYITGGDPRQTKKLLKQALKNKGFVGSVLDSPKKLLRAWMHLGSSVENSNRVAIYNAAIAAGKSKKRAAYEAKDLMDFSMGGDWAAVQFLIQTVPFMNARAQGMYRLGRGAVEHPVAFTMKGLMISLAGLALYAAFKDDERYKELEAWDRHAYYHWWVGDTHYRLPKPFEVGAIFNTIPEMMFNYAYDKENDAGKTLLKEFAHMAGSTFNMNPIPQTARPLVEAAGNYNFFTGRPIVSYYESRRLPQDQYRYRTSPTMIELARRMPEGLNTVTMGRATSPLHLQNMYAGYTGTIGRYVLQASDMMVERMLDYPLPPSKEIQDYPLLGRFNRGDNPPRRTKYETEVYAMLDKVTQIQGSLNFHEKQGNLERYLETHEEHQPYILAADALETVRENIQNVNRAIMIITLNKEMEPGEDADAFRDRKQQEIDVLEETRNTLFKEGWKLRPGGEYNPETAEPPSTSQALDLIDEWGVDDSVAYLRRIQEDAPDTHELLEMVSNDMTIPNLASLAKTKE